jgi:predicted DCC family thiol-disulfide oxidoreductase YuxK
MNLWKRWRRYWFRPALLIYLAACRIVIVAFQLFHLGTLDRHGEFGRLSALPEALYYPLPILRLLTLPVEWATTGAVHWRDWQFRPSAEVLEGVYWVTYTAGVLALVGLKTKLSLFIFAAGSLFLQSFLYSFKDFHHPEALLMITLVILAFSPVGRVLSIDDLRRRLAFAMSRRKFVDFHLARRQSVLAWWPLLLTQWLFALVYFSAALSKLKASGFDWANGYTLQYYLLQDGVRWGSDTGVWLSSQHTLVKFMSVDVSDLRRDVFPGGAATRPGLDLHSCRGRVSHGDLRGDAGAVLSVFTAIPRLHPLAAGRGEQSYAGSDTGGREGSRRSSFDGQCPLCIRSMTMVRYFDWFDCLTFSDLERRGTSLRVDDSEVSLQDLRQEKHVVTPDGSVRKGFFAFREALKYTPPLWPLLALLHLPFAAVIGPRLYSAIASQRARWRRCELDVCTVHSAKQ